MRGLILVGGGEHARSVGWAAQERHAGWLRGLLDPNAAERTLSLLAITHLGDDERVRQLANDHDFVLGLGAVDVSPARRQLMERIVALGGRFTSVVHPTAIVASTARIGVGAVILAGAIVGPGSRIGEHAVVNTAAVVEHDCEVGAFAQLAPGVVLGGAVRVEEDAFVGMRACVRDHRRIGRGARVAMGAVVTCDVPAHGKVRGVPARAEEPHA